jgi:hypothetical protein
MVSASLLLSDQLTQLAHYLGGEFDNRQQSLRDPVWYLHLRLWLRPLPHLSLIRVIAFLSNRSV